MKKESSIVALLFLVVVTFLASQFLTTNAYSQSGYFTSQGCSGCHRTPVVATCNGCHAHGTHANSAKSGINVSGTTNKSSYAPGEQVSVTISGGYRTGWVRVALYNENQVEIARSTGNASGMGGSTTLPAVLTANAPMTAGTYTWKVSWYGNMFDSGGATYGSGWTLDPNNPEHGSEIVALAPFTVVSAPAADTTAPLVDSFVLPATAGSLVVPVTAFLASDNVGVTGYLITTSATAPLANDAGWSATAPATATAPAAGTVIFYAWAKDAAGNVSASASATVVITLPDATAPLVDSFVMPATAGSLVVPVTAFLASDNVGVTGYLITTSATTPSVAAAGWSATAPTTATAPAAGTVTFYAWAKDAAGNVSASASATVTITIADATAPQVDSFVMPATAGSLVVPVTAFLASDNVGVTGYLITTSATTPSVAAAGWSATAPTTATAPAAGTVTFYAWAKDAAGNVSASASATVTITIAAGSPPVLSVSMLDNGAVTRKRVINISGTATDPDGILSVSVNGKVLKLHKDNTFSTSYRLSPGANVISVIATDTNQYVTSDSRTIYYDTFAPQLTVSEPSDHAHTADALVTVSGTIDETAIVTVAVNGGAPDYAVIAGNTFSAQVALNRGMNTIIITATDLAGNKTKVKRTVIYDDRTPELVVSYPRSDVTTNKASLVLKGKVKNADPGLVVTITMGANTYTPAVVNGKIRQELTFPAPGVYEVVVTATNSVGTSTIQRTIIYQPREAAEED